MFTHSGRILVAGGGNGHIRLVDTTTDQVFSRAIVADVNGQKGSGLNSLAVSPSGTLLVTAGENGTVQFWGLATGKELHGVAFHRPSLFQVLALSFSPDGKVLAIADSEGYVWLWDMETASAIRHPALASGVGSLAFSPDGKILATGGGDGKVRLWSVPNLEEVSSPMTAAKSHDGVNGGVEKLTFSPDGGMLATIGQDGTLRRWNVSTGREIGTPVVPDPEDEGFSGVAFSPDGASLATADQDGTARLWNPSTGQGIGIPIPVISPAVAATVHESAVNTVAFNPTGSLLAAAGDDGTVQLWPISAWSRPYQTLCAEAGPPSPSLWSTYAPGATEPRIC
jgi:WD40 repeat protein